jgi:hypothetical protein
MLVVQVTLDIAHGIDRSVEAGVAHREITMDNIGIVNGRGVLYDFSAAKVCTVLTYWVLEIPKIVALVRYFCGFARKKTVSCCPGSWTLNCPGRNEKTTVTLMSPSFCSFFHLSAPGTRNPILYNQGLSKRCTKLAQSVRSWAHFEVHLQWQKMINRKIGVLMYGQWGSRAYMSDILKL